ncbi:MAG: bifunctional DNA-formamidopyrimidine glycosylase/DNA-(apurinic or apyrimidinic site) lyase [Acidobacteria bacterium]|nr:bifunctional DNA-formamidopyrimidine glycosylase/DNA-(apurinic or apyrimidinic site) lyase [Acidobacteriota bacterium]
MPELPEIETIRLGLGPLLAGRRILGVRVGERRLRWGIRREHLRALRGARFTAARRRSKYLLLDTDSGRTLLIHLGMTGQIWVTEAARPRRPHEHVVFALEGGRDLRFADSRRFGTILVVPTDRLDRHPRLDGLGPEPFDVGLTGERLRGAARGRTRPVKNFLIDTRQVAGIGNIYACEALHRAGIDPRRPAGRIGAARWERLLSALREVLEEAIRAGGTTFRDYLKADGDVGSFAVSLRVYDRAGRPCPRCGRRIRRIVLAGRSTFYCSRCQR